MSSASGFEKWVWLAEALRPGCRGVPELLEYFGTPEAIYSATESEYRMVPYRFDARTVSALCKKDLERARTIISECVEKKIRIITRESREYPDRLRNIPCSPVLLYARGEPLELDFEVAIAIVGTRSYTQHGENASRKLGRELATLGGVVVTGLAKGIDAFAAEGSLSAGGKCIGVLGCGLDIYYPRENKNLIEATAKQGTLISEFPPGTPPLKYNFPVRNRLMSGMTLGTVIVEAPERSGALITARYALEQDRDLFAVPSGIFTAASAGSNQLIKEGAIPVTSGADILEEYDYLIGNGLSLVKERTFRQNAEAPAHTAKRTPAPIEEKTVSSVTVPENLPPEQKAVLMALSDGEMRPDAISSKTGIAINIVLSTLTLLEINGLVKKLPGNRFQIK